MNQKYEYARDVLIDAVDDEARGNAKADLTIRIDARVSILRSGAAGKLEITAERLADLKAGKAAELRMLELQALASRAGNKP